MIQKIDLLFQGMNANVGENLEHPKHVGSAVSHFTSHKKLNMHLCSKNNCRTKLKPANVNSLNDSNEELLVFEKAKVHVIMLA